MYIIHTFNTLPQRRNNSFSRYRRSLYNNFVCVCLNINRGGRRWGKEFGVNLGAHERRTGRRATNEVDPNGSPAKLFLQRTNGQETNRGRDGTTTVDEARHGAQGLVVATDRRMRGQVGRHRRSDNVVGSAAMK